MSIGYTVEIVGLAEQLEKLGQHGVNCDRRLREAMQSSVTSIRSAIVPLVPIGVNGKLRGSIVSEVTKEGPGSIVGKVGSNMESAVYPMVMEFGRKPGTWISKDGMLQLINWVHKKHLAGVYSVKASKSSKIHEYHARRGNKATQESQDKKVAYAIMYKIHDRGITGVHFMERGFNIARNEVIQAFETALEQIAEDLSNGRS